MLSSLAWLLAAALALLAAAFVVVLPAYTAFLAIIASLRARLRQPTPDGSPWSNTTSSLFQGRVFHVRHRPAVHSFRYPLFFAVVDLDEASELFGKEANRGTLWPLSTLMALRDADHLKNGEGLPRDAGAGKKGCNEISLRERILNLVHERTEGRVDLRSGGRRRRMHLVTHLMYYGYCFNPVSFYFILKPRANKDERTKTEAEEEEEEIEAIVVEISNTPWNEMSVYVLHPQSADMAECDVYPRSDPDSSDMDATTRRYKWNKNFHVSPFMTMDHIYDWTFQWSRDRIKAQIKLIRRKESPSGNGDDNATTSNDATTSSDADDREAGLLYFTGGFDIRRQIRPSATYPLQLARVIARYPIYCLLIQLWIHYEALRLLLKGVAFVPHPEGSESGASRAIAVVMAPVFAAMDVAENWWGRWKSRGEKGKAA
ncbi:hypothetical protein ACHAXT_013319 [Thalassiosira profunda]